MKNPLVEEDNEEFGHQRMWHMAFMKAFDFLRKTWLAEMEDVIFNYEKLDGINNDFVSLKITMMRKGYVNFSLGKNTCHLASHLTLRISRTFPR